MSSWGIRPTRRFRSRRVRTTSLISRVVETTCQSCQLARMMHSLIRNHGHANHARMDITHGASRLKCVSLASASGGTAIPMRTLQLSMITCAPTDRSNHSFS
jgi:hypothetical protein